MLRLGLSACLGSRVAQSGAHRSLAGPPRAIFPVRGGEGLLLGLGHRRQGPHEARELAGDGGVGEVGRLAARPQAHRPLVQPPVRPLEVADMGLRLRAWCHADSTSSVRTWPLPARVILPLDTVSPLEDSEGTSPR